MNNEIITNNNTANIYLKIQMCREELRSMNIKKTGYNSYVKFNYYTLEDLVPPIAKLLKKYNLFSHLTFTDEIGTLTILDINNPEERITFTAPMRDKLQSHGDSVQNLGATITYMRRYFYLIAFDITEFDALDATIGRPGLDNQTNNTPQDIDYIERNLTKEQKSKMYARYKVNNLSELSADIITACVKKIKQQNIRI